MLKPVRTKKTEATDAEFAIIASNYNSRYVDGLLRAASAELKRAGAKPVKIFRVPGAYEIPVIAAKLAQSPTPPTAIICLGVVLRGETTHAQNIIEAVSHAFALIQVQYAIPVIHEVLLLENEAQARARCLNRKHNRGREAAQTALEMARLIREL